MISAATLGLWLRAAPIEHADALADLVASGDLTPWTQEGDVFGLERAHAGLVTSTVRRSCRAQQRKRNCSATRC